MKKIIVSACLLGCKCRYDGESKPCEKIIKLAKDNVLIPVCPEQLGGLSTPRMPAERQKDGSVKRKDGEDVTKQYELGAQTVVRIAEINGADFAVLKSRSPACGKGEIYDGSFTGRKINGNGVAAQMLIDRGFLVYTEEEIME